MLQAWTALQARMKPEHGATMVEYGIIVALVAAVSIVVIGFLGIDVLAAFQTAETNIDGTTGG